MFKNIIVILSTLLLVSCESRLSQKEEAVEPFASTLEAYEWLLANSSEMIGITAQERLAIQTIATDLNQELQQRLISDLSLGGKEQQHTQYYHAAFRVFQALPASAEKLIIARKTADTYPIGKMAPFVLYIASFGGESDMKRIREEIAANPKGWGYSVALACRDGSSPAGKKVFDEVKKDLGIADAPPYQPIERIPKYIDNIDPRLQRDPNEEKPLYLRQEK